MDHNAEWLTLKKVADILKISHKTAIRRFENLPA
jgi:hypothetical protein